MGVFATAGGPGPTMDVVPLLGCWFVTALTALVALVAAVCRSLGWSITALCAAVYQAFAACVAVVIHKPPAEPDPDDLFRDGDVERELMLWSAVGLAIAVASLVWVVVKRRQPLPNSFAVPKDPPPAGT